jgi:hypothetical protein
MGKKDAGFLGGLIAAAAYGGIGWSSRGLKTCTLCREAIVPPAGYRVVPGGFAHGACAQKAEGGGKDARQGQADGAPDPGSVCPEG